MIVDLIDKLKERSQAVKLFCYLAIAVIILWSTIAVDKHHAHTWMEHYIPGWWSLVGLVSCTVLIFFAVWLGKSGVMTREDYYDN